MSHNPTTRPPSRRFLAMRSLCAGFAFLLVLGSVRAGEKMPTVEKGTVAFKPAGDQKEIPERYRLGAREFDFELAKKQSLPLAGVDIYDLRFPSPVKSPYPENNTVHAEYYRPTKPGPFPCVIVLDITGGNQEL